MHHLPKSAFASRDAAWQIAQHIEHMRAIAQSFRQLAERSQTALDESRELLRRLRDGQSEDWPPSTP